jgi:uncharacterized protein (DUF1330 family)
MNTKYKYALVMGAGFALGAVAVQALHAQAKPPAYLITEVTVKDQDAFMKEFAIPGMKPIQEAGAKFLARGSKPISLAGDAPAPRVTVIQFGSMDKAQEWWNSPGNKDMQAIGDKYASFRTYLVEGLSAP